MLGESDYIKLGLLLLCLVLSAFFSGSETAFIALQRVRLIHLINTGFPGAKRVAQIAQHPEQLLSTVLLGNNLVNTAAAALGTALVITLLKNTTAAIVVSTIGVTLLLLIFCEVLPKSLAARHPERIAFLMVRPLQSVGWLLFPFIKAIQGLIHIISRLTGGTGHPYLITEQEIRSLISVGKEAGTVEPSEAEMLEKVFHFGDRRVSEVMTPRPELVWVEKNTTMKGFLDIYSQHPHTRFPVCEETVDNVIGLLLVKDVVRALAQDSFQDSHGVTHLLRPAYFVPETKEIGALFTELRERRQSIAMIVDEFGGIAGLATLKKLVEVIVGPVTEEGEPIQKQFAAVDENTYLIDPALGIPEANEFLHIDLPLGQYQTVAGFVLERLGRIPNEGDYLNYGRLRLTVTAMNGVKIERVEVQRRDHTGQGAQ